MADNVCDDWCVRDFVLTELDGKIGEIVDYIIEDDLDTDDSDDIASVLLLHFDDPQGLTEDEVEWACRNIQAACGIRQLIDMGMVEEYKPGFVRLTEEYRPK